MKQHYHFKTLIGKYYKGECSEEERSVVESWLVSELQKDLPSPSLWEIEAADDRMRQVINAHTGVKHATVLPLWPKMVAAAVAIVIIGLGLFLYTSKTNKRPDLNKVAFDIKPGGNKAFLTLTDGKRIALTDIKNGELAEQSGVKITKAADGQLIYTVSSVSDENSKINAYNIIETPRGGTYQVRLPDGTKVWLNAASALKYPVSFSSRQARRVLLLSGEAYFEVAKDKKHPFIVQTDQQEVKVLGTHFNINSYTDEKSIKTTLLEGSVKIEIVSGNRPKQGVVIRPGQQSVLSGERIRIVAADIESDLAWKNQEFVFKGENIQSIMRKLSRWYDIEVNYNGDCSHLSFYGVLSRSKNISSVLKLMENAGNVNFKIDGKKITVNKIN